MKKVVTWGWRNIPIQRVRTAEVKTRWTKYQTITRHTDMKQQRTWKCLTWKTSLVLKDESHGPSRWKSTDLVKHILITYIFELQNLQIIKCSKYLKEHNMFWHLSPWKCTPSLTWPLARVRYKRYEHVYIAFSLVTHQGWCLLIRMKYFLPINLRGTLYGEVKVC